MRLQYFLSQEIKKIIINSIRESIQKIKETDELIVKFHKSNK